jgi:uncharacterized protein with HEPN domain
MKSDRALVLQILESIRRIEENTSGGREAFFGSHTLQDAVLRNLHTMSESAQRLSDSLKRTQPDIDWKAIGEFRNVLVHDYLGIDLDLIWLIVHRNVPELKTAAEAMLEYLPSAD